MTWRWVYQRFDAHRDRMIRYQTLLVKDACDGWEINQGGPFFTRKGDAERYCKQENKALAQVVTP
jgi:hypothetical protein